jgi:hypothetical protein
MRTLTDELEDLINSGVKITPSPQEQINRAEYRAKYFIKYNKYPKKIRRKDDR